jgi:hypothetical protein
MEGLRSQVVSWAEAAEVMERRCAVLAKLKVMRTPQPLCTHMVALTMLCVVK